MIRFTAAALSIAVGVILFACADDVPSHEQEPVLNAEQQALQEPAEIDDSLCTLLDPLVNRRPITEPAAGYGEVVDAIEQGATINARCAGGGSPLHLAAASHGSPVVELLLEHGADIHAVNSAGETPLIYAVGGYSGLDSNGPVLDLLLSAGADIDARKELGQSALHVAAVQSKPNALATLLQHEPDLEVVDNHGYTALHYAAVSSATAEPTRLLLEAGLDPNAAAIDDMTPLHFAATNGNAEITRLLLEAGADPNQVDEAGLRPLHYAAPEGGAAVIRVLLEHGADPNYTNPDGAPRCTSQRARTLSPPSPSCCSTPAPAPPPRTDTAVPPATS